MVQTADQYTLVSDHRVGIQGTNLSELAAIDLNLIFD